MFNLGKLVIDIASLKLGEVLVDVEKNAGEKWGVNTPTLAAVAHITHDHSSLITREKLREGSKGLEVNVVFNDIQDMILWLNNTASILMTTVSHPERELSDQERTLIVLDETGTKRFFDFVGHDLWTALAEIHKVTTKIDKLFKQLDAPNKTYLSMRMRNGIHSSLVVLEEVVNIACQTH